MTDLLAIYSEVVDWNTMPDEAIIALLGVERDNLIALVRQVERDSGKSMAREFHARLSAEMREALLLMAEVEPEIFNAVRTIVLSALLLGLAVGGTAGREMVHQ